MFQLAILILEVLRACLQRTNHNTVTLSPEVVPRAHRHKASHVKPKTADQRSANSETIDVTLRSFGTKSGNRIFVG